MNPHAEPVGGRILTRTFMVLFAVWAMAMAILGWRFLVGLGAVTGLSDGYPWGIWIAYDVVTGTALACGGFSVAILCYVLNRGKYHPLIRPAVLTSALGYSLAGFSVVVDVGRYWNLWKVPLFWNWNRNSVLLEVAMCIMAYMVILWIELAPAFLEKWEQTRPGGLLCRISFRIHPYLDKAMIFILALGILLPTMHQSSLGSLLIIAVGKVHKLWHTPLLPVLFLASAIMMGYAAVVFESALADAVFDRPRETKLLASLAAAIDTLIFVYLALRLGDLAFRGRLGLILALDVHSVFFLVEIALFLVPALLLLSPKRRQNPGIELLCAIMLMLAGTLYRFDAYLIGFSPGPGWRYFPTVPETLVTIGLVSFELMAYLVIVKRFPILHAGPAAAPASGLGAPAAGR